MPFPLTTTHLAITGISLASAGGLAYGGYEVLKDHPRPVAQLLKTRNRVFLKKEGPDDEKAWKDRWEQYVQYHTKTVPNPDTKKGLKKTKEEVNETDIWNLSDWKEQNTKKEVVPLSFKDKCAEWETKNLSGTWTEEYQNVEKYCTKLEE